MYMRVYVLYPRACVRVRALLHGAGVKGGLPLQSYTLCVTVEAVGMGNQYTSSVQACELCNASCMLLFY